MEVQGRGSPRPWPPRRGKLGIDALNGKTELAYVLPDGNPSWNLSPVAGSGTTFSAPGAARNGSSTLVAAMGAGGSLNLYSAAIRLQDA